MYQRWYSDARGVIHVVRGDGTEFVPTLSGGHAAEVDRVEAAHWQVAVKTSERWTQVPPEWLIAMEWQESRNPYVCARNPEKLPGPEDDGVGPLQITNKGLKAGYTDAQLCDPATNYDIGARYIQRVLIPLVETKTQTQADFPRVSAAFNSGGVYPSGANEWGLRCTGNHVDAEVAALNYLLLKQAAFEGEVLASQFDLTVFVDELSEHGDPAA